MIQGAATLLILCWVGHGIGRVLVQTAFEGFRRV